MCRDLSSSERQRITIAGMKGRITRGKCSPFVAFWCKRGPLAGRGGFAGVEKGLGGIGRERERERERMGAEKFEDGRAIKSIRQIVSLQSPSW